MARPKTKPRAAATGPKADARSLIARRHPEWTRSHVRYRWLADSLEAGETYRAAEYPAPRGTGTTRNLVRHKHEAPEPGKGEHPDYALRLERTPVPTLMAEAVETHLSKIYAREIRRDHPDAGLMAWWQDVDGANTSAGEWMADVVAPLLLAIGHLDLAFDRPMPPEGEAVASRADERRLGLDRCLASIVLPENMLWWRLDPQTKRYAECLVREFVHDDDGRQSARFRHWTADAWTLYDDRAEVLGSAPHPYGRVPIERVFDQPDPRRENVGKSRYEAIAELQREWYNKESELILSDTLQAHPVLQGPEDYIADGASLPVGPGNLLGKKKVMHSGGGYTYEGFDFVEPPKGPAESIRENIHRHRDAADRHAKLTKPAGAKGSTGSTVAQSGVSKVLDQKDGNEYLGRVARALQKAEWVAASLALCVIRGGPVPPAEKSGEVLRVVYPTRFDLLTAGEKASLAVEFQAIMQASGDAPDVEADVLKDLAREMLPARDDADYRRYDQGIDEFMAEAVRRRKEQAEGLLAIAAADAAETDDDDRGADDDADD